MIYNILTYPAFLTSTRLYLDSIRGIYTYIQAHDESYTHGFHLEKREYHIIIEKHWKRVCETSGLIARSLVGH